MPESGERDSCPVCGGTIVFDSTAIKENRDGVLVGCWECEDCGREFAHPSSDVVPTANENRPVNTAVRFLVRAWP